ncbi:hypothetical protein LIER_16512 [Lithospermum erythrorhizon]|uniref:Uncharacterized protein n=1 Tax=Lithospermum erythrorhizon TaxID=34254 RepID=A0AAV3Q6X6_LITER
MFHSNFIHQPPEPLHPTVASWPFDAWELDMVGPLPKKAVLLLESQILSLRMAIQEGLTQEENAHLRLEELESLDERRLDAQQRLIITPKKGKKFVSKWDGPYIIREVYTNGSYLMIDQDGVEVGPINGRYLKLYYP